MHKKKNYSWRKIQPMLKEKAKKHEDNVIRFTTMDNIEKKL